jgi:cytochrome c oxidase cbb3-type subunit 2
VRAQGWRGVCLVAITYVYFLIFAQFAFLHRLAALGIADAHLKAVMAAMAFAGILFSLLTPRTRLLASPSLRLQAALSLCSVAAALTLLPLTLLSAIALSLLIGTGLGVLTVTLVSHLRCWVSTDHPLLDVGVGTGLGYLVCNLPALFNGSILNQVLVSAGLCLAGMWIIANAPLPSSSELQQKSIATPNPSLSFSLVLLGFTALVWLDSAAFFIIQKTPALKAGTWEGTLHLWINGGLHLIAALASVWLLRRRGLSMVLSLAVLGLAGACLLLLDPHRAALASVFYSVGVSLYSVALVAYPSLLAPAISAEERGRRAGWIYAIAGWFGSAMGIGMGQHLGHVPALFVLAACAAVLLPQLPRLLHSRGRELLATAAVLLVAASLWWPLVALRAPHEDLSQIERGRQVYISEGCIHCHSQYVRPNTADVLLWGPTESVEELRLQHPPLIGNRRQGPDLSQVGARRSTLWLAAHFDDPAEVTHGSFMPSFAYLFRDQRGGDLIAYLKSLHSEDEQQHLHAEQGWKPSAAAQYSADASAGTRLFARYCATCHSFDGVTRQRWMICFRRLPPVFPYGPFMYLPASDTPSERRLRLALLIKFGLHGTDMPGHEYLSDSDIASLSLWLSQTIAQHPIHPQPISTYGEPR